MVISLVALVVAMSGTAVAAGTLVNGDKLIRKGTLSANRLRKHTLTGRQINLNQLGKVPSAATADSAGSAGSAGYAARAGAADSATNATSATNAGNAAALGGRPASGYLTTGSRIGTNGMVKMPDLSLGTTETVTAFAHAPFTVTVSCTRGSNGDMSMSVDATSSESDSVMDGSTGVPADAPSDLDGIDLAPPPRVGGGTYTLEAPSGATVVFAGSFGTDSAGVNNGCWATFAGIA
jgi:hypothetical protein